MLSEESQPGVICPIIQILLWELILLRTYRRWIRWTRRRHLAVNNSREVESNPSHAAKLRQINSGEMATPVHDTYFIWVLLNVNPSLTRQVCWFKSAEPRLVLWFRLRVSIIYKILCFQTIEHFLCHHSFLFSSHQNNRLLGLCLSIFDLPNFVTKVHYLIVSVLPSFGQLISMCPVR